MSRAILTIKVNYHPATSAMARVTRLLDFARDEYGVRTLEYTIVDPDEVERWEDEGGSW